MLRALGIAGLALAVGIASAAAQEMRSPRVSPSHVAWDAAAADLSTTAALEGAAARELLAKVSGATGERFPDIAASPVPVLLPFDTAAYMRDRAAATGEPAGAAPSSTANYLFGFSAVPFFYPGPAGYDAVVVARPQDMPELKMGFSNPVFVHIGGSALVYDLEEPHGIIGWPVHDLDEIPGIRRIYLESYVRYTFVRYGVPYVVAIECLDGGSLRYRKISCRDADKLAIHFLKALRVVGGTPQKEPDAITPATIDRPSEQSTVFTYHGPGDLLPGTGFKRRGGVADYTVYSKIRFPLADAPAFANSQSFMNWGNCEGTGRSGAGTRGGVAAYRCRVNGLPLILDESAVENYSYPWRDNFCETRNFYVGQCPAGLGHQGQDIRPAFCKQRVPGANRCEPYLHDVVAVRDGAVLRAPSQEALYLVVNAPNERLRFRYLHMLPRQFDADGLVSGRLVREGEVIGKVGNFFRRQGATSYHLHFDLQVPTKYGWVFVNPYMTLVASYERLIRGRGQEIKEPELPDEVPATASIPHEVPVTASLPPLPPARPTANPLAAMAAKPTETAIESGFEKIEPRKRRHEGMHRPAAVTASLPADLRRRVSGVEHGGFGAGQFRAMGRSLPRPGPRAGYIRRHLHAGDGQYQTGYGGI